VNVSRTVLGKMLDEMLGVLSLKVKLRIINLGSLVIFVSGGSSVNGVHSVHVVHVFTEVRKTLWHVLIFSFVSHKWRYL
jgi:hypothetical protein